MNDQPDDTSDTLTHECLWCHAPVVTRDDDDGDYYPYCSERCASEARRS